MTESEKDALLEDYDLKKQLTLKAGTVLVKTPFNLFAQQMDLMEDLSSETIIEYVEPDLIVYGMLNQALAPNDKYYNQLKYNQRSWLQDGERHVEAWDVTMGDPDIVIAITDTQVDLDHEDFCVRFSNTNPSMCVESKMIQIPPEVERSLVPRDTPQEPWCMEGHGTCVAGAAAAAANNNGKGIAGVCPKCKILPLRIFNDSGGTTDSYVASAIDYTYDDSQTPPMRRVDVVNGSWGEDPIGGFDPTLKRSIERAIKSGVMFVFASGNTASGSGPVKGVPVPGFPACMSETIAVGATYPDDTKIGYSQYVNILDERYPIYKEYAKSIDVMAQGEEVMTTDITGDRGFVPECKWNSQSFWTNYWENDESESEVNYNNKFSGTSAAAPQVSGLVGLILSRRLQMQKENPDAEIPNLTVEQVRKLLQLGADDIGDEGFDEKTGWGRINGLRTLKPVISLEMIDGASFVDADINSDTSIQLNVNLPEKPGLKYGEANDELYVDLYGPVVDGQEPPFILRLETKILHEGTNAVRFPWDSMPDTGTYRFKVEESLMGQKEIFESDISDSIRIINWEWDQCGTMLKGLKECSQIPGYISGFCYEGGQTCGYGVEQDRIAVVSMPYKTTLPDTGTISTGAFNKSFVNNAFNLVGIPRKIYGTNEDPIGNPVEGDDFNPLYCMFEQGKQTDCRRSFAVRPDPAGELLPAYCFKNYGETGPLDRCATTYSGTTYSMPVDLNAGDGFIIMGNEADAEPLELRINPDFIDSSGNGDTVRSVEIKRGVNVFGVPFPPVRGEPDFFVRNMDIKCEGVRKQIDQAVVSGWIQDKDILGNASPIYSVALEKKKDGSGSPYFNYIESYLTYNDVLTPTVGYFVELREYDECEIVFDKSRAGDNPGGNMPHRGNPMDNFSALYGLEIEYKNPVRDTTVDYSSRFGVSSLAGNGNDDLYDILKDSSLTFQIPDGRGEIPVNSVSLTFNNTGETLSSDIKAEFGSGVVSKTWDFKVDQNGNEGTVKISLDEKIPFGDDYGIALVDLTDGKSINMKVYSEYEYVPTGNSREFNISVRKAQSPVVTLTTETATGQEKDRTVRLSWNPITSAVGYRIYRKIGEEGEFTALDTLITDTDFTERDDAGYDVMTLTEYNYRVSAVFQDGYEGPPSDIKRLAPLPKLIPDCHTYEEYIAAVDTLASDHPDLIEKVSLAGGGWDGTSFEDREIPALKLINKNYKNNPWKSEVMLIGNQYGGQCESLEVLLNAAETLADEYDAGDEYTQYLLNNVEIMMVPSVNVDGLEYNQKIAARDDHFTINDYGWSKNRREYFDTTGASLSLFGVDLNRSYNAGFGLFEQGDNEEDYPWQFTSSNKDFVTDVLSNYNPVDGLPDRFRGRSYFGEVEIFGIFFLTDIRKYKPIVFVDYQSHTDYSTDNEEILMPWARFSASAAAQDTMFLMAKNMSNAVRNFYNGSGAYSKIGDYGYRTAYESKNNRVSGGWAMDWMYNKGSLSFTFELGEKSKTSANDYVEKLKNEQVPVIKYLADWAIGPPIVERVTISQGGLDIYRAEYLRINRESRGLREPLSGAITGTDPVTVRIEFTSAMDATSLVAKFTDKSSPTSTEFTVPLTQVGDSGMIWEGTTSVDYGFYGANVTLQIKGKSKYEFRMCGVYADQTTCGNDPACDWDAGTGLCSGDSDLDTNPQTVSLLGENLSSQFEWINYDYNPRQGWTEFELEYREGTYLRKGFNLVGFSGSRGSNYSINDYLHEMNPGEDELMDRVRVYDGNHNLIERTEATYIRRGGGFWFEVIGEDPIPVPRISAPILDDDEEEWVSLKPGWNIIAIPYYPAIPIGNNIWIRGADFRPVPHSVHAGWIGSRIFGSPGGDNRFIGIPADDDREVLVPGKGYLIYAYDECFNNPMGWCDLRFKVLTEPDMFPVVDEFISIGMTDFTEDYPPEQFLSNFISIGRFAADSGAGYLASADGPDYHDSPTLPKSLSEYYVDISTVHGPSEADFAGNMSFNADMVAEIPNPDQKIFIVSVKGKRPPGITNFNMVLSARSPYIAAPWTLTLSDQESTAAATTLFNGMTTDLCSVANSVSGGVGTAECPIDADEGEDFEKQYMLTVKHGAPATGGQVYVSGRVVRDMRNITANNAGTVLSFPDSTGVPDIETNDYGRFSFLMDRSVNLNSVTVHHPYYILEKSSVADTPATGDSFSLQLADLDARLGIPCVKPGNPEDEDGINTGTRVYNERAKYSERVASAAPAYAEVFLREAMGENRYDVQTYPFDSDRFDWHSRRTHTYSSKTYWSEWRPKTDLNGDGDVDRDDIAIFQLYLDGRNGDGSPCTHTTCGEHCIPITDAPVNCGVKDDTCSNYCEIGADGQPRSWKELDLNNDGYVSLQDHYCIYRYVNNGVLLSGCMLSKMNLHLDVAGEVNNDDLEFFKRNTESDWVFNCRAKNCGELCLVKDADKGLCASENTTCNDNCLKNSQGNSVPWHRADIDGGGLGASDLSKIIIENQNAEWTTGPGLTSETADMNGDGQVDWDDLKVIKQLFQRYAAETVRDRDGNTVYNDNGEPLTYWETCQIKPGCVESDGRSCLPCDPTEYVGDPVETIYGTFLLVTDPDNGFGLNWDCVNKCVIAPFRDLEDPVQAIRMFHHADAYRENPGDTKGDGHISIKELYPLKKFFYRGFGSVYDPGWERAEYTGDGRVNLGDRIYRVFFGKTRCQTLQDNYFPSRCTVCDDDPDPNSYEDCVQD